MKAVLSLIFVLVTLCGCAPKNPVQASLPPGAINSVDAQINSVLQSAHAAAVQYATDKSSGFIPSTKLAEVMSTLITLLNIADPAYQTYHSALKVNATSPVPADLAKDIQRIQTTLTNITSASK